MSAAILATDSARPAAAEPHDSACRSKDRSHPALRGPGPLGAEHRLEHRAEQRQVVRLATLVGEVVSCIDTPPADEPLHAVVARCNAALEGYLETEREREAREREDPEAAVGRELQRLARLLLKVDRADAALVIRQIRRVLGRFDAGATP